MVMSVFDHFEGKKIYSTIINYCHRLHFCWHFLNLGKIAILSVILIYILNFFSDEGHLKKNDFGYSIQ